MGVLRFPDNPEGGRNQQFSVAHSASSAPCRRMLPCQKAVYSKHASTPAMVGQLVLTLMLLAGGGARLCMYSAAAASFWLTWLLLAPLLLWLPPYLLLPVS